jgi:Na+-transporting NADH:ubiquinone oxidoreductase subunit E
MENLVNIFVRAVFVDNMVFAYFLGMCSYLAISKKVGTSMSLGIAVMFLLGITVPLNYLLNKYILEKGALAWLSSELAGVDLSFLSFIVFIAVIASLSQILEMLIERFVPALYATLGIFLPLIAVNCAILGGSLFMQERAYHSAAEAASFGIGSGFGWLLAIAGIAAIREKLSYSNILPPLRGLGISFIVTGLLGIAFMCFLGIKIG